MTAKRIIILHYGMSKTGSSSIQSSLYKKGVRSDFEYVDLGAANANGQLILGFSSSPHQSPWVRKRGLQSSELEQMRRQARARLRRAVQSSPASKLILSAECLSSGFEEEDLRRLGGFLSRLDVSPLAVGYVRRPKSFIESMFQQTLKGGSGRNLEELHTFYPHYERRFSRFDAAFGKDNVKCWLFAQEALRDGDVVKDFVSRIGFSNHLSQAERKNDGLSLAAVSLLYIYRRYGEPYGVGPRSIRENRSLIAKLAELDGPKFKLHSTLIKPVLQANQADIEWMVRRHGCDLEEDLEESDSAAVKSEAAFVEAALATLPWLKAQIGGEIDSTLAKEGQPAAYIAALMARLRRTLSGESLRVQ